ncbi:hypothetical protein CEP52_017874 [Fusarium oligoseptatum]|uniref:Uncharacterized protein n=1 Tax=Fusarium oligoseptatum TaxID=2604345 RepID=A0A428RC12_9HYPO|nr:hypothetical protein CEP52_017874 [Fusarium oligoseptatum]
MNCSKCITVQTWKDEDFEDSEHAGDAICLRCWGHFTKRKLREHLNGPLCPYKAEQPRSRKMMMLYTIFCSGSEPPTLPPKPSEPPGHSRKRKRRLELSPLCSAASPVTSTPATLAIQPNQNLSWPDSLEKMKLDFILCPTMVLDSGARKST